jgi:hypothetical protein
MSARANTVKVSLSDQEAARLDEIRGPECRRPGEPKPRRSVYEDRIVFCRRRR